MAFATKNSAESMPTFSISLSRKRKVLGESGVSCRCLAERTFFRYAGACSTSCFGRCLNQRLAFALKQRNNG